MPPAAGERSWVRELAQNPLPRKHSGFVLDATKFMFQLPFQYSLFNADK